MTNTIEQYELNKREIQLVQLRDELYFGSWVRMESDLKDRLNSRPYIFQIVNRIEEDLKRIDTLQSYELKTDSNLSEILESQLEE